MTKKLSILGSTGSIGVNSLLVVDNLAPRFDITYLTAYKNSDRLIAQAKKYAPKAVAIVDEEAGKKVRAALNDPIEVLTGRSGLLELAGRDDVDIVMNGLVGSAGMEPTLKAIEAGVDVALSNKESLVMAGSIIESTRNARCTYFRINGPSRSILSS